MLNFIDGERLDNTATIVGGFLGALVVILLTLSTAVGIVFIKKGIQNCPWPQSKM